MRLVAMAIVIAITVLHAASGAASAAPPSITALVPVSAQPMGPAQPTEQRTHCARTAPLAGDRGGEPAGHRQLDIGQAWRFSRGAGVTVAVIDTGITPHPRLPALTGGGDYVTSGDGLNDCDLHGTVVAGIIAARPSAADGFAGVAPEARLLSIRQSSGAFEARSRTPEARRERTVGAGYGPLSTLARAIVRAAELGAKVINISEVACAPADEPFDDDAVASALAIARRHDAVVVAAAGNLSDTGGCREQNPLAAASPDDAWLQIRSLASPARFGRDILTVGAVDARTGQPAEFSLRGPWLTVAAPGTEISSVVGGNVIDGLVGERGRRLLAGTSYAAAYVSGVVALVRSRYPQLSAAEVIDRVVRTAHGGPDPDAAVGYGIIDPVAALTADLPDVTALPDPGDGITVAAPRPRPPDHGPAIAVAATLAVVAAGVAAVFAVTRRRR
ncbi:peptidase S8 family protein [Gordonia hirsuta DSM 44140 = NBRC 16056]|uniref:Peptidase S8 family protein n=2 Tax=Gordonia hirsuta TaxID=53427 RepID=L7LCN1_9ACTN|nr:type VII secretion-associated serine protease mycosin [Gordonia hirsuta]GAC58890.1 peptidase S8 family protein [Gordonia hirsuta DSM 44140 = NBRC 16056]